MSDYHKEYYRKNKDKIIENRKRNRKRNDNAKLDFLCARGIITPFAHDFIRRTSK